MRDLLYKNLTSENKKRKVISCSEVADNQGTHSVIHRHFVYIVREVNAISAEEPAQLFYLRKERNTKEHIEKFFCRIKGSVLAVYGDKIYKIIFAHSLKISLGLQAGKYNLTNTKE